MQNYTDLNALLRERPCSTISNAEMVTSLSHLIQRIKDDPSPLQDPPHLSHYRDLPQDVTQAYDMMMQSAQVIHATSTKYTLMGKIDSKEQVKLGAHMWHQCQILAAAMYSLWDHGTGCCRAARQAVHRATLAVLLSVLQLVSSFTIPITTTTTTTTPSIGSGDNNNKDGLVCGDDNGEGANNTNLAPALQEVNLGAQKTGAVWESCDTFINKLIPQGNRNAMRRELFQWTRDTNDSMEEFHELISLGPTTMTTPTPAKSSEDDDDDDNDDNDDKNDDDDFFVGEGEQDQYTKDELLLANPCLGILKCSRGTMKLALDVLEHLGSKHREETSTNTTTTHASSDTISTTTVYLDWIVKLHQCARVVGEGVTDFGSLLYPPLLPATQDLQTQLETQVQAILEFQEMVLELEGLPTNLTELAHILKGATETRRTEFLAGLEETTTKSS